MKNTLLAIVVALSGSFAAHAQYAFPLADLQKLAIQNANDFETAMLTQDYSMQSKASTATVKMYTSDKAGPAGKKYTISRSQVPSAAANVMFTNTDKKWYLELKKQLTANGYKFVKEDNRTINGAQATGSTFANNKLKVSIYTYTTDVPYFGMEIHL